MDERRLAVLRAIVEDFVSTSEPVGSKALVDRHHFGVSPATIRNDMALLEDEGLIAQPHTSAGRVPTDKGYRLFVDRLAAVRPLSAAERRAIAELPGSGGGPRRRPGAHRPPARAAHPAGRAGAVPAAGALHRAAHRSGPAVPDPGPAGADHEHRPGRAAADHRARRGRGGHDGPGAHRAGRPAGRPVPGRDRRHCWRAWSRRSRAPTGPSSRPSPRRWRRPPAKRRRSGSSWRAPPT